jgi:diguanylate cyclase (GGDEF)-like protein/PAS domain S-box-containing protein
MNQKNKRSPEKSTKAAGQANHKPIRETRFRSFIENLSVMFYAAEPHPPYAPIYISPTFEQFGYPLEEWRESLDLWTRVLHADDREWVLTQTEAAMRAGKETDYEYRIVARDGTVHWVRDRGSFVRDERGETIYWQGIILDITESKRSEQKLQRSEKLYRTLAHSIPQTAVLLFDPDFRYTLADGLLLERHGFSSEMFEGKTLWEVFPPDICEEWSGYYRRSLAGETVSFEQEFEAGWFQIHVVPVKNESGEIFAGMVMWQDITVLKHAEQELRALFEAMNDAIIVLDKNGRYLKIAPTNPSLLYRPSEELIGKTLADTFPAEQAAVFLDSVRAALETKQTQSLEYMLRIDGRDIWFVATVSPMTADSAILIARDTTARREIEEALKESEERYRNIFENANDLIYVHDLKGNYLSVNHAAESVFGYTHEEALRMNIAQITAPEHLEYATEMLAKKIAGARQTAYEVECITKSGNRLTLEVNSTTITKDGVPVAVQGIARNVTERRRTEEALREREEQYRDLFENANDLIYTHDLAGNFTSLNGAGEIITGFKREEALRMNIAQVVAPDYLEAARRMIASKVSGDAPTTYELEIVNKGGSRVSLELSTRLILQNGAPVGVQGIGRDITARKRAERSQRASEAKLKDLFDNAPTGYHELNSEGRIIRVNQTEVEMLGYKKKEMLGRYIWEFVVEPASRDTVLKKLSGVLPPESFERTYRRKDGSHVPVLLEERLICDENGTITGIRTTVHDITERKRAEEALKISERRYRSLGEGIMHQVWTAQPDGKLDYVNGRTLEYLGQPMEQIIGDGWLSVVHPDDLPESIERWTHSLATGDYYEAEFRLRRYDGKYRWHQARATAELNSDGQITSWFGTNTDIDDRKIAEAKLNHFAGHDTLTNLPNRAKFMNHLTRAVSRSQHNSSFRFAVLFLDLDRFKIINDSLGHITGDKLLIALAKRLEECVRPNDVVARLGGDEFTILLCNINEPGDAVRVANRVLEKLSAPFKLDTYEVFTSASIGIIVSDEIAREPDDFLRDADTAMYRAKEAGKSRYEIFDREMHIRNMNLLQLENDLRRAIEQNEFRVFYQPIVELATGKIRELEALIRWQHPTRGMIAPNDFICIAEETGLIIPIGGWILREACLQTAEWQRTIPSMDGLSISVNLSAKQLMHPNLTTQVGEILTQTSLNPRCLKLEVTESMVMENSDKALAVISELHRLGTSVSTDDFGTGYSSLSYLHRFPFNRLKIDRSFVSKMDDDQKSDAIVRTILLLAQNLNIEAVAEGIETEQQLERLRFLGCQTGQGYLFSKPVTAETAAQLLRDGLPNDFSHSNFSSCETNEREVIELDKIQ